MQPKKYNPFRQQGLFMFPKPNKFSMEKQKEGKNTQEHLLELMYMHQAYHDVLSRKLESQYALRGSIIKCNYGFKAARLDCISDHGVLMGRWPVLTCRDCNISNIHNFDSCMCPEVLYMNKKVNNKPLPMTAAVHPNGKPAMRAVGNRYAHICVPLIGGEWLQEEAGLVIEDYNAAIQALVGSAVLVCQYGGIITILEVPTIEEDHTKNKTNELYYLSKEYMEWFIIAEGANLFPYLDTEDSEAAKERKNVTLGPGITFDATGRNWDILEKELGWTEKDIETIIEYLFENDEKKKNIIESEYAITMEDALRLFQIIADREYIPNLNAAIKAFREENEDEDFFYSQRELEAMFDYSYNNGLSPTEDTGGVYSSAINNPDKIIYYYLRKDLEGAVAAVKKHNRTGERRRINQMYLFFIGYNFLDSSGDGLESHREELGF